jgi:hypothetical protein
VCYVYKGYTSDQAAITDNKVEYGRYVLWQQIAAVSQHQLQAGDPLDPLPSETDTPGSGRLGKRLVKQIEVLLLVSL